MRRRSCKDGFQQTPVVKQPNTSALEGAWTGTPERLHQFTSRLSRLPSLLSAAGFPRALPLCRSELQSISIQGQCFDAEVDTDAVKCTISRKTAEQLPGLDLDLTEGQQNLFQLLNGKQHWSIGKAKASCRLMRNGETFDFMYTFHILEEHYVPVSLGRELLQQVAPELFPANRILEFDDHSQFATNVVFGDVPLVALADTGSSVNITSRRVAEQFMPEFSCIYDQDPTTLYGLTDTKVRAYGPVTLRWSAPEAHTGTLSSEFYITDTMLGFDVVLGDKSLIQCGVLTPPSSALKRFIRDIGEDKFQMYGLRSESTQTTQRLRCQINGHDVLARADTGAPVPLVSPADALKFCADPKRMRRESEPIALPCNSLAQVTQSFDARLAIGTKTVQTRFYTLVGITAPTLSAELLFGLNVFAEHAENFIEVDCAASPYDLKGGKWVSKAENKLLGFGRRNQGPVQVLPTLYELVPTDPDFLDKLCLVIAKEDQRRIDASQIIASQTGGWRQASEDAEKIAVDGFEAEKTRKRMAFERHRSTNTR